MMAELITLRVEALALSKLVYGKSAEEVSKDLIFAALTLFHSCQADGTIFSGVSSLDDDIAGAFGGCLLAFGA